MAAWDGGHVTGIVFEDVNGNGIRDAGEKGVEGVLVSNQRHVVQTDHTGRYYLPIEDNMTIFVTKPAGYQVPLDDNNLPQFYYHHFSDGSPDILNYPGVEPSGPLPASLDFPLVKVAESERFTFMAMGDPQTQTHKEIDYLRDSVIAALPDGLADFNISLGDLMFDRLDLFPRYNDVIGQIGIPVYNAPGNHDLNFEAAADHCWDTFRRYYGPDYYSFTYGKAHFMVLNTVIWHGKQTESWWGDYKGGFSPDQLIWIENNLRYVPDDHLVVFAMHIPLYREIESHDRQVVFDRDDFLKLVRDRKHLLSITGHIHANEFLYLGPEQGWHGKADFPHLICGAVSGTWWTGPKDADGTPVLIQPDGAPSGVFLFHVDGNQFKEVFYPLGLSPDYQVSVSSPRGIVARSQLNDTPLLAKVFIGNERTTVVAELNGRQIPMRRTLRPDPFKAGLIERHKELYKGWVSPRASTHIWQAQLPDDLAAGVHRIDIKATLHDGRILTGKHIFEVSEKDN